MAETNKGRNLGNDKNRNANQDKGSRSNTGNNKNTTTPRRTSLDEDSKLKSGNTGERGGRTNRMEEDEEE
jgi:hypothetical protein